MPYWTPLTTISECSARGLRRANLVFRRPAAAAVAVVALALAPPCVAKTLKFASTAPDGTTWMKSLRQAGTEVEAATEGRIKLKFYPGGVQGDDADVLRKMRIGQLHGGTVRTGVFGKIYSDVQLYNLPMVFHDLDEVDAVRASMDPLLMGGLADAGFVALGIAEVGMAYAMSTKAARSLADARRLKIWSPQGDVSVARTLSAFRISPIPLTIGEVLPSLTTGAIDTVAAPPVAVLSLLWHTRLKYVLDLPFMYVYSPVVVYERSLKGVLEADRAALLRIFGSAVAEGDRRNRGDHDAAWQALRNQGLEFQKPAPAELSEWRSAAQTVTRIWVEDGMISDGMYAKLKAVLAQIREGQANRTVVTEGSSMIRITRETGL